MRKVLLVLVCFTLLLTLGCESREETATETGKKSIPYDVAINGRSYPEDKGLYISEIDWLPNSRGIIYKQKRTLPDSLPETLTINRLVFAKNEIETLVEWKEITEYLKNQIPKRTSKDLTGVNTAKRGDYKPMRVSPDGRFIVDVYRKDIFTYDLKTKKIDIITKDAEEEIWPTFSPDGKYIAYAKNKNLFVYNLNTKKSRELTQSEHPLIYNGVPDWVHDEELDLPKAFWWSPQSDKILYIQFDTRPIETFPITDHLTTIATSELQQYPKPGMKNSKLKIGVLNINTKKTTWLYTGAEKDFYLAGAGWLPDGSRSWFQIINRPQNILRLMFSDPDTGDSDIIYREEVQTWVEHRSNIIFVDEKQFLWTNESDGWNHIYLYDIEGNELKQITEGEWEVSKMAFIDRAKENVYFTATKSSPLERQIYRAALDGSGIERITNEDGTHYINSSNHSDYFINNFTNVSTPKTAILMNKEGEKIRTLQEPVKNSADIYKIPTREFFTISMEDGEELNASLMKPVDFDASKKYPVLVYIYGGPGSQSVRKSYRGRPFEHFLIQEGILIFSVDNRGTGGRGREFEQKVHRILGHWELKDHLEAVEYLKEQPYVDGDRIGIYGGSYGGFMVLQALLNAPGVFKCGISSAPVTSWHLYDSIYTERYMDHPEENKEGYENTAPLNMAAGLQDRLLLIHGIADHNVHMQNSIMMVEEFMKAGKHFDFMLYPRERHGIKNEKYRVKHLNSLMINFLFEHLLDKEAPVNVMPSID